ncbi:MAG: acyltransferase [Bacillota bacterium]
MGCFITGDNIKIGNNSVINRNCYLDGRAGVVIGNNVNVSPEVYILSLTHDVNDPSFKTIAREVVIEDNSWIGVRAIIMPGVNLEKGCVVGAGAVVTKSFPCYSIVAGIPASLKAKRSEELNYQTSYFPYFNTDITKR